MTETLGAKTTITFQGIKVTATKDRLWHVEAAGRSASAAFLDHALDLVLPRLSYEDLDSLLIRLLVAAATGFDVCSRYEMKTAPSCTPRPATESAPTADADGSS